MKQTCTYLLLLLFMIYLREGYQQLTTERLQTCSTSGNLSDVAQEVIAIPLETNSDCILQHAKLVKKDKHDLFLVNQRKLYRFSSSGKFINQITHSEIDARQITPVELGRFTLGREISPEVSVVNEKVYVQSTPLQPDLLVRDTLYLLNQNKLTITENYTCILPCGRVAGDRCV